MLKKHAPDKMTPKSATMVETPYTGYNEGGH